MENNKNGHLQWVDGIKGFAILCVVLGHIAGGYIDSGLYPSYETPLSILHNIFYSFHMSLFFVVSGILFAKAYTLDKGLKIKKENLKRQILNFFCVYTLFSVTFGITRIILSSLSNHPNSFADVLLIWLKPLPDAPYWYLYVLIALYIIFSFRKLRFGKEYIVFAILLFLSMLAKSGWFTSIQWLEVTRILMYGAFFYSGYLYETGKLDFLKNNVIFVFELVAIFIGGGVFASRVQNREHTDHFDPVCSNCFVFLHSFV